MGLFDFLVGCLQQSANEARKVQADAINRAHEKAKKDPRYNEDYEKRFQQAYANSQRGLSREELKANREIIELMDDEYDYEPADSGHYRQIALENTKSDHGWYTCPKCGKKYRAKDMDVDHILPQSKGGDDSRYNLQLLCRHCNRAKQDDTSETAEDLERRSREIQRQREEDYMLLNTLSQQNKEKKK